MESSFTFGIGVSCFMLLFSFIAYRPIRLFSTPFQPPLRQRRRLGCRR
jgi:hypothetical protein